MSTQFQAWIEANPRYNAEGYEMGRMSAINGGSQENLKRALEYLRIEEAISDFYLSWTAGYFIGTVEREHRGKNKTHRD